MATMEDILKLLVEQQRQIVELLKDRQSPGGSGPGHSVAPSAMPTFPAFDSTSELWKDYLARFQTFSKANAIPEDRLPQVFLTNQTANTYKLLSTLSGQETPPKDVNGLSMEDISKFMETQFDPKRFIVRERFKFWSEMRRKPGETVQELAARIRQDAARCDFPSISDPQDEAMRTRFICSISNEAVLKAIFKIPDNELTFSKAIQIALETEDAAKVAKETCYGSHEDPVHKIRSKNKKPSHHTGKERRHHSQSDDSSSDSETDSQAPTKPCHRCGFSDHSPEDCPHKKAVCNHCGIQGHIQRACQKKKRLQRRSKTNYIQDSDAEQVNTIRRVGQEPLRKEIIVEGRTVKMEIDTGSADQFIDQSIWILLGRPRLYRPNRTYIAGNSKIPVIGRFFGSLSLAHTMASKQLEIQVTTVPRLNILGRSGIRQLKIDVTRMLQSEVQEVEEKDSDSDISAQRQASRHSGRLQATPYSGRPQATPYSGRPQATPYSGRPQAIPYSGRPQAIPYSGRSQTNTHGKRFRHTTPDDGQDSRYRHPDTGRSRTWKRHSGRVASGTDSKDIRFGPARPQLMGRCYGPRLDAPTRPERSSTVSILGAPPSLEVSRKALLPDGIDTSVGWNVPEGSMDRSARRSLAADKDSSFEYLCCGTF